MTQTRLLENSPDKGPLVGKIVWGGGNEEISSHGVVAGNTLRTTECQTDVRGSSSVGLSEDEYSILQS